MPTRGLRSPWWFFSFFLKREMVEGRYRMIQGSEDAVLWLQLSEALTAGMLGDLRGKKRRTGKYSQDRKEGAWRALYLPA